MFVADQKIAAMEKEIRNKLAASTILDEERRLPPAQAPDSHRTDLQRAGFVSPYTGVRDTAAKGSMNDSLEKLRKEFSMQ